jgi:hypothetical protein
MCTLCNDRWGRSMQWSTVLEWVYLVGGLALYFFLLYIYIYFFFLMVI